MADQDAPKTDLPVIAGTPAPDPRGMTGRYHGRTVRPSAVVDPRTGDVIRGKVSGEPLSE